MNDITHRLRSIREARALTQEALAARLGVPVRTLRNWEQGSRQPSGLTARLLAQLLSEIESERKPKRRNVER